MEYVDYQNMSEQELRDLEKVVVVSKLDALPLKKDVCNISPHALGMSIKMDLEKRRSTLTDAEKAQVLAKSFANDRVEQHFTDKVSEAASILKRLENNVGSLAFREALATRMQLRRMALKNFAANKYSDALLQAHYSLLLAKRFHMEMKKTPISGEMAMELLILSKCYGHAGDYERGKPHLLELKFLIENTVVHLTKKENMDPSLKDIVINVDVTQFPALVYTMAEIFIMYSMWDQAFAAFEQYLGLVSLVQGANSVKLAEAISKVCMHMLRAKKFLKALPLANKILEIYKSHHGDYDSPEPHTLVAQAYSNVGIVYRLCNNPIDALHYFLIALDMQMRICKNRSHYSVQQILLSVGCCQHALERFHEAASIYQEVYQSRCRVHGKNHPLSIAVEQLIKDLEADLDALNRGKDGDDDLDNKGETKEGQLTVGSEIDLMWHVGSTGIVSTAPREPCGAMPSVGADAQHLPREIARIQALYKGRMEHLQIPIARIMPTHQCIFANRSSVEMARVVGNFANPRLPIINVPCMERGKIKYNQDNPIMQANPDAVDLLATWGLLPPQVTADGNVITPTETPLPQGVQVYLAVVEDKFDLVRGFYDKPIMVPNPAIFHYKTYMNAVKPLALHTGMDSSTRSLFLHLQHGETGGADSANQGKVGPTVVPPVVVASKANVSAPGGVLGAGPKAVVNKVPVTKGAALPLIKKVIPAKAPPEPLKVIKASPEPLKPPVGGGKLVVPKKAAAPPPGSDKENPDTAKGSSELTDPGVGDATAKSDAPVDLYEPKKAVPELPPEPPITMGELLKKKLDNKGGRNAKFLAKIGKLANITVKPNSTWMLKKTTAPIVFAANVSDTDQDVEEEEENSDDVSVTELDDSTSIGTSTSDEEHEEDVFKDTASAGDVFEASGAAKGIGNMIYHRSSKCGNSLQGVVIQHKIQHEPVVYATLVESPILPSGFMEIKSLCDSIPLEHLQRIRAIKSLASQKEPQFCMLLDGDGEPVAKVPWQLDLISLTLAKSSLITSGFGKVDKEPTKDSAGAPTEKQVEVCRKMLAGEGLAELGFGKAVMDAVQPSFALQGSVGIDVPIQVLEQIKRQREELQKQHVKAEEQTPKVVPIKAKTAPKSSKAAPKGPPKSAPKMPPKAPGVKSGAKRTVGKQQVDDSKVRRFFWDPLFGDEAEGTLFAQPKSVVVKTPELEEDFAKAVPKQKGTVAAKPKVISLLPDSKRAYNMNIGLSKFTKFTFKQLREAILDLDPSILTVEATESLLTLVPSAEECSIVSEFIKSGGDLALVDRPDQFVAVMTGIPLLKPRLQAHYIALLFKESFQEISAPLDTLSAGCEAILSSTRLSIFANYILTIGNALNEGDAKKGNAVGFKPTTFAKLNDFRTTTRPVRTLLQYICDMVAADNEEVLDLKSELLSCEACTRLDMTVLEANLAKFKADITRVKTLIATANTSANADAKNLEKPDCLVSVMTQFIRDAEPKVALVEDLYKEALSLFHETARHVGYPERDIAKLRVDELFKHIWGFAQSVDVVRKQRQEQFEKQQRLLAAKARQANQATRAAAKPKRQSLVQAAPKMLDDGLVNVVVNV